jgi:serine phosphatase RsbU (regulator of sigma subunit)
MLIEYKGDKQPIGKHANEQPFTQQKIKLLEGDSIYIASDGYADQFGGPNNKKFMYKPFKQLFLSMQNEPMDRQRELLIESFNAWKGKEPQVDDVCVIGVKV